MEFSLNAVWLLLAVAGTYFCAKHQITASKSPRDFMRALLASSVLCVFLFPVISATDDLHPAQALIEETTPRKTISGVSSAPLTGLLGHSTIFLFLLSFLLLAVPLRLFGRALESSEPVAVAGFIDQYDGRAPPSVAHSLLT